MRRLLHTPSLNCVALVTRFSGCVRRIAAGRVLFSAGRGRRGSESVHVPRRQPAAAGSSSTSRIRFPTILGWHRRCLVQRCQQPRCHDTARLLLLREAPTPIRPWVGHRLRRLCSAEERKARGPRAQRASCSDSLRLSERSERSSRSEFRNGATRLSTTGHRRLQGDGAASEAADGGPPAAHARPQTSYTATGRYAPQAAPQFC